MKRQNTIVELGKASRLTKGIGFLYTDVVGKQDEPGLNLA